MSSSGGGSSFSGSSKSTSNDNYCWSKDEFDTWSAKAGTADLFKNLNYDDLREQDPFISTLRVGSSKVVAFMDPSVRSALSEPFRTPPPSPENVFEIQLTDEMGYGLFATRDLAAGRLILVEQPILIQPAMMSLKITKDKMYEMLLEKLDPATRRAFLNLSNCKPRDLCSHAEGVFRTNGQAIELPASKRRDAPHIPHSGVFLNVSRCNHSCGPNASKRFDDKTFSVYLRAVRPIKAGEEITISFTPPMRTREERRAHLRHNYHYDCLCTFCDLPSDAAIAASDARRVELDGCDRGGSEFDVWLGNRSVADDSLIKSSLRSLIMIEREGLQDFSYGHLDCIARCYGALGDRARFKLWAEKARLIWTIKGSPELATIYAKWIAKPESFPFWNARKLINTGAKVEISYGYP